MQGHYLLNDLLNVGDAAQGNLDLGNRIIAAGQQSVSLNDDVTGAIGALAVVNAGDVRRQDGLDRAVAGTGDNHDTLVRHGVDGAAAVVLTTVMKKHQRYFDVPSADGLASRFVAVANGRRYANTWKSIPSWPMTSASCSRP